MCGTLARDSHQGQSDHKSLRAVCKGVHLALGPLFFSSFILPSNRLHLNETATTLEALANGQIGWTHWTKTLIIRPGRQPSLDEELGAADACIPSLDRLLSAAIGAMQNIRTVRWQVDDRHPPWALNSISEVLHMLPLLTDLQLSWWPTGIASPDVPWTRLSKIRKLTISSRYRNPTLMADQVCRLVQQNHGLTSLYLLGGESAGWSGVWTMLRLQNDPESPTPPIHLTDICTDMMTRDLLEYLSSYSGLERLQYRRSYGGTREAADALADIFYDAVLPCHSDSLVCLRDLDALTSTGTRWGFGHHNADKVSRLQKLEILEMSVNAADVLNVEPMNNAVDLLLATAAGLPALRLLSIWYHWYSAAHSLGPASRYLPSAMNPAIKASVQNFCTRVMSPAVVLTDRRYYALRPVNSDAPQDQRGGKCEPVEVTESERLWTYREDSQVGRRVRDSIGSDYLA